MDTAINAFWQACQQGVVWHDGNVTPCFDRNCFGSLFGLGYEHEGDVFSLEVAMDHRKGMGVAAVLIGGLTLAVPSLAADKIGEVVAVVGKPQAKAVDGTRDLAAGSDVFEDDSIVTAKGNAQILLRDGTKLVVGPDSNLLLDRFLMKGKSKAQKVSIMALRGTYRFITGKSDKSAYNIATSSATIGIRGTAFDFWVKKKTGAVVLKGAVLLKGLNGGAVDVKSGCQMGEATTTSARPLLGAEKAKTIRENLPYLLDQSQLNARFRLDVTACRLQGPDLQGGEKGTGDNPQPQDNRSPGDKP